MSEMASYADAQPRGPGVVDQLRDQNERLHHQIELLAQHLGPVLRPDPPVAAATEVGIIMSALDEQVAQTASAVERIIRLRDRLAV